MKLPITFYQNEDVVSIARQLIGKILYSSIDGQLCSGLISETEAYAGITDKASHAYGGRRSARTDVMYAEGGLSYVYLCYGMHHLFNVVTGPRDVPTAVLVRGLWPLTGIDCMLDRTKKTNIHTKLTDGPGKLTKALGITLNCNRLSLTGNQLWIESNNNNFRQEDILVTKRIGIAYAGEDADLPYRFLLSR